MLRVISDLLIVVTMYNIGHSNLNPSTAQVRQTDYAAQLVLCTI